MIQSKPKGLPRLYIYIGLVIILLVAMVTSISLGVVSIEASAVVKSLFGYNDDDTQVTIVFLRFSRVVLAVAVGASLAVAGSVFQGLFRNPLADPYVIGTSGGAALGAVSAIAFGAQASILGFSQIGAAAFVGGLSATIVVYLIANLGRMRKDAASLLLTGTALGSLFSALVSIILAIKDKNLHQAWFWLLGGFSGRGFRELAITAPALIIGLIAALLSSRVLDILSAGDEESLSLGLHPTKARLIVGSCAALSVSASVALSGAIGFVGLIAPHLARRFVGPNHIRLIPASALIGAILLVAADTLARIMFAPLEMPVGAMIALIGAPFFIYRIAIRGLEHTGGHE